MKKGLIFAAAIAALCDVSAQAQDAKLSLSDPRAFREAFSAVPMSGTRSIRSIETLVGVRVDNSDREFSVSEVRVALGANAASGAVCLRVIARDGRYTATASYQTDTARGFPIIEAPTRFGSQLKEYRAADMAIVAFVAPGCDMSKVKELFAIVHGAATKPENIVVQLNTGGGRVRAQLTREGKQGTELALCGTIEVSPRIGFTNECRFPTRDLVAGVYTLTLVETTTAGASQTRSYPLRVIRGSEL